MSKAKECWNCRYYSAYYTKGFCQFDKQRTGFCHTENRIVEDKHQTCDKWCNDFTIKNIRQVLAIKRIDETLDCLLQIKQILVEEKEEIENANVVELSNVNRKKQKYLIGNRNTPS